MNFQTLSTSSSAKLRLESSSCAEMELSRQAVSVPHGKFHLGKMNGSWAKILKLNFFVNFFIYRRFCFCTNYFSSEFRFSLTDAKYFNIFLYLSSSKFTHICINVFLVLCFNPIAFSFKVGQTFITS
jgi:hypothetical protein